MTIFDFPRNTVSHTQEITANVHGHEIRGWYEVKDGYVVVNCEYGSHRARRGGINDEQLAVIVLKDIATMILTD